MMEDHELFRMIHEAQTAGQNIALATVVRTQGSVPRHAGSKMLVWPDGKIAGTVGGGLLESRIVEAALQAIQRAIPELITYRMADVAAGDVGVCGGTVEVFVEPLLPPPTVLVIGCGHVGKEVAVLAKWLGFRVLVSDDREDLCSPEHIPEMDGYFPVPAGKLAEHASITSQTYIAAMTRGQVVDVDLLPALVISPARYIGLIGSRRRWALTAQALRKQGVSETQLARVFAPVGLELEAETPREIAVSVMAQIIMIHHGGDGTAMRWMGPSSDEAQHEV
jgi:xanthine dehydrogenase accessory factor